MIASLGTNGCERPQVETVTSASRWYKVDFASLQFAGNIGFVSIGAGLSSAGGRYHFSLLYGYVPTLVSEISVHTITARNTFEILRISVSAHNRITLYGALSLSFELGGHSFFLQPSEWPKQYYRFPKSIHLIPALGAKSPIIKSNWRSLKGYELFAEVVTVDAYLWYKTMSDDIRMMDILSCSVGINLVLR